MKKFSDIWEAIQNGTFLTSGGVTYRIDFTNPGYMNKEAESYCVGTHSENTGENQYWYFNEIEELVKTNDISIKILCDAEYS